MDALSTKLPTDIVVSGLNVTKIEFTCQQSTGNGTTQYVIFNFADGTKRQYSFSTSGIGAMYYNGSTWSTLWSVIGSH